MIDLNLCAKCTKCGEFYPSRVDDEGRVTVLPSVFCTLEKGILMGDSELPDRCPYILEQTLLEERAIDDFENLKEEVEESDVNNTT